MNKKQLSVTFVMLVVSSIAVLQAQDAIDKYFAKYADNPDFTSIVISEKMFQLFATMDDTSDETSDIQDAMSGLTGIRILTMEADESDGTTTINYSKEVSKLGKEYELLMSVDEKDEKIRFFIFEEGDQIKELFMIVGGQGNLFLMSLVGDIDLAQVSKLSKNMNIGGVNYLENLDEESNED